MPFAFRQFATIVLRRYQRWLRYAAGSVITTTLSEVVLVALYLSAVPTSLATILATIIGTAVSYLLSRYWVFPESRSAPWLRQSLAYWVISLLVLIVAATTTSLVDAHVPGGHLQHLFAVAGTYLGVYLIFWGVKFWLYRHLVFVER